MPRLPSRADLESQLRRAQVYGTLMRAEAERAQQALARIRELLQPVDLTPPWTEEAARVAQDALTRMRMHPAEIEATVDLGVRLREISTQVQEDLQSDDPSENSR